MGSFELRLCKLVRLAKKAAKKIDLPNSYLCCVKRFSIFLKLLGESVAFAFHALRANKLRTFLSLLGISIGIFAIISVFTVVDAMLSSTLGS